MPVHFLSAYLIANHAFVNNAKLRTYDERKLIRHFIWVALVFLALTFDVLLASAGGIAILGLAVVLNFGLRFLDKKIPNFIVELLAVVVFVSLSAITYARFEISYITPVFSWYLCGMLVVTVGVTYFFRRTIISKLSADSIGITERLVIFIFLFAGHYEWVAITVLGGVLYRLVFSKDSKTEWIASPVAGVLVSVLWLVIMRGLF
ncbi:MAG TPA: hypothetical protein DCE14_03495 [Kosmotogaceae bacterium]|nr:MAG: Uncharacterized protein XE05_0493 [Thermotogales bacterium 46_20]HAA85399.1 hypothetical protein [Kosmotogaceae bacterium]